MPTQLDRGALGEARERRGDDRRREVGTTVATPQLGHSVHVELGGLDPDRWYWYRFRAGDATSPIGRARTMPVSSSIPAALKFAFASCQHFEQGLFTAYEHMLKDELDLVVHLGDYIYEGSGRSQPRAEASCMPRSARSTITGRKLTCEYRSDQHLQDMHARCPWVVTWDDHEVDNNYADATSEEVDVPAAEFLERRANAYQAYYEMMPLRRRSLPRGPHLDLYRTVSFGRLAAFQVLDTRQYRTDQPNGDRRAPLNEVGPAPASRQHAAGRPPVGLAPVGPDRIAGDMGTCSAQQVMMGMVGFRRDGGEPMYSMDQWPGYAHERMRVVRFLQERRVPNPVVLTGDIHSNWVNDLRVDDRRHEQPVVATEFVGTSITTGGNRSCRGPGPGPTDGRESLRPVLQCSARIRPLPRDTEGVEE